MVEFAAVVLAGGAGRRMGGPDKPRLPVAGVPMLLRVLDAVADARPRVVVGPDDLGPLLPDDVLRTREDPPGGGPLAGCAAGLALVGDARLVGLFAADQPFLTRRAVDLLRSAVDGGGEGIAAGGGREVTAEGGGVDGAVFTDGTGRPQNLCAVWRTDALRDRLAALGDPAGVPVRRLAGEARLVDVAWSSVTGAPPPWYDCDTRDDLRNAEEWHASSG